MLNDENQLVILKQLPEIIIKVNEISKKVEKKTSNAMNLVVTDETVKDVKKVRAELNKEFAELEADRKQIKAQIMAKYEEFEQVYNEKIKNLYNQADDTLKEKINNVEQELIRQKENNVKDYFYELRESKNLVPYIEFDTLKLKVTLSATETSLKRQIKEKMDSIENDINLINLENNKDEILNEYLKCYDFAKAKLTVVNRIAEIERIKQQQAEREAKLKEEQERISQVENTLENEEVEDDVVEIPTEIEVAKPVAEEIEITTLSDTEETYIATFQVTATITQLKDLKLFMQQNSIKFENI